MIIALLQLKIKRAKNQLKLRKEINIKESYLTFTAANIV
jgi:hypothetical protein